MNEMINLNLIPAELKKYPCWVNWTREEREGKLTKVPLNPKTGGNAQTNNPSTWASYDEAVRRYGECENERIEGIGFVPNGRGYVGVDLDHCRAPETGLIESWAQKIISQLSSYCEVTPSQAGVRIWVKATLPVTGRKKGNVEMYSTGRFFTVTGQHLQGTPLEINERQEELTKFHAEVFGTPGHPLSNTPPCGPPPSLSDAELIGKAQSAGNGARFSQLWSGNWAGAGYPSQSEADLAFCSMLAFWTGKDAGRIDALFRESALFRGKKWDVRHYADGRTYGEATIEKAIAETKETYRPADLRPPTEEKKPVIEVGIHLTDWGNAKRLVAQYGTQFRYCFDWNRFLVWDRQRWAVDNVGGISRLSKQTISSIYREAAEEVDKDRRRALSQWAIRCESENKIQAMIELAKSEPGVYIKPEELDQDPWLLNVENGTIDLKTGLLRKPGREDLITKLAPVHYDPLAECPLWMEHLTRIMEGKLHLINFLQRVFGYCLTGVTGERAIFIAWGKGANGKSTTQESVSNVLGRDYSDRTTTETLLIKRDGAIPNDLAKLRGMRFVYASEAEEGKKLAESLVKDMTGGDRIAARFMRAEWFSFAPTFKLWLATNHKPIIHGTDNAIWDRIKLIPFTFTIPYDERIPHDEMFAKFQPESSGILAWMVRGCLDWQKMRLGTPEEVTDATAEYRDEMDLLGNFINDCCETSRTAEATSKELYDAYLKWAEEIKEKPLSKRSFGASLMERGFVQGRAAKGARKWVGITLHGERVT